MGDHRLRGPVRDVLALTGDRALPARPFSALVEVPVRASTVRSERPTHRLAMAVAAVLVLLLGVVGLRAVGGRDVTTTTVVASRSERTVAVPLYMPGMALVSAGMETSAVSAPDGTLVEASVATWERRDARITISSSPADLVPEPSGGRAVDLQTGAVAFVVERDNGIFMSWQQPDGGPTVGIRSTGLALAEVVAIADSTWFVTPAVWADLTDHAGFASQEEASEGYDPWSPPTDVDLDGAPAVFVRGGLQQGLSVQFFPGNIGFSFGGPPMDRPRCFAGSLPSDPDADAWPVVFVGPTDVTAFVFAASDGTEQRVPAVEHPGLPQLRFAVASTSAVGQGMPLVECERGAS